jgi:chromosome segregation ATPase
LAIKNLEEAFHIQLRDLRADILGFDQTKMDYQRKCQSNEHLIEQLEAERAKYEKLNEQLRDLQCSESKLKMRTCQLQSELDAWKTKACDRVSIATVSGQEMIELRDHLNKTEHQLQEASNKLDQAKQLQQTLESEAAHLRVSLDSSFLILCITSADIHGRGPQSYENGKGRVG